SEQRAQAALRTISLYRPPSCHSFADVEADAAARSWSAALALPSVQGAAPPLAPVSVPPWAPAGVPLSAQPLVASSASARASPDAVWASSSGSLVARAGLPQSWAKALALPALLLVRAA